MKFNTRDFTQSMQRDTIQSMSTLFLLSLWLVVILYLVSMLPGIDRIIPQTPVTVAAVIGAVVTLAIVGILLVFAPKVAQLVRMTVNGPQEMVQNVAAVSYWGTIMAAILIAHRGLAGLVTPFVADAIWLYDLVFLVIAFPVVVAIGFRLYASLDRSSTLLTDLIVDDRGDDNAIEETG